MMRSAGVVLVGPYPPPHGGVSVHVEGLRHRLEQAGMPVRVINASPGAPASDEYIGISGAIDLLRTVRRQARGGWVVHAHINGHNTKSWLLALLCGIGGRTAPRTLLTVHSGMVPDYLGSGGGWRGALARQACRRFGRVICVSEEIRDALVAAGARAERLVVVPAYLARDTVPVAMPETLHGWLEERTPLLSSTLAFEPEYRFDLLAEAVARLRRGHPALGCVVMGGGSGAGAAAKLVQRLDLGDAIKLLGDVDHDVCLRLLGASDLYLRCTDRDGDAVSVREALALGIPVVASDVGHRPAGAHLFPAGDVDAMVAAVVDTLHRQRAPAAATDETSDGGSALVGLYKTA